MATMQMTQNAFFAPPTTLSPQKKVFIVYEMPRLSDGTNTACEHEFKPTDEFSHELSYKALELLGGILGYYTGWPHPERLTQGYAMKALPYGYSIVAKWEQDMNTPVFHISGHPSGNCYMDLTNFAIHMIWLYGSDEDGAEYECSCALCEVDSNAGKPANLNEYMMNEEGPWFPSANEMPMYNPLMKPEGAKTFFHMLGPVLPVYDNTTLRNGVINLRRAAPPAIQVSAGNAHQNGVRTAPLNTSNPMVPNMQFASMAMQYSPPMLPPSPMFVPGMGILYGPNPPRHHPAAVVQAIANERNALLLRADICGSQMNTVINNMNRAGLVSPVAPVSPMTFPPVVHSPAHSGIPPALMQQFPPNSCLPVPQHRHAPSPNLPIPSQPLPSQTPFERAHSATMALQSVTSGPDTSTERQRARAHAALGSPLYKPIATPKLGKIPKLTKSSGVTKALKSVARNPSKSATNTAEAYENSFETALTKGHYKKLSDASNADTVVVDDDEDDQDSDIAN